MPRVYRPGVTDYYEPLHPAASPQYVIPPYLRLLIPTVGSIWAWEPLKPAEYCHVRVSQTTWNGESAWVESEPIHFGDDYQGSTRSDRTWTELARWMRYTVYISPPKFGERALRRVCTCEGHADPDCARHGHEHCNHTWPSGSTCCICEFGKRHTEWIRH